MDGMAGFQTEVGWLDAHRADLVTGQTVQAAIHVVLEIPGQVQLTLEGLGHQGHPAARRFGFAQAFLVGGAHRQAKPTADTVIHVLLGRAFEPIPGRLGVILHVSDPTF